MITVDKEKCNQCKICINRMKNYCISEKDGFPVIDYSLCNLCQKCVSICPAQAILVNNTPPEKIKGKPGTKPEDLYELFRKRRSIKVFKEKEIPKDIIGKIVNVAKYAPNQNKNIDIIIVDDKNLIDFIDKQALAFFLRIFKLLFSFKPLTLFFQLFSSNLPVIRKKMEHDLMYNKRIVKKGTQVLILLIGNKKVPITESSAQYLLATMIYYAESLNIGTCLMDSLKISANYNKKIKKKFNIKRNVLGVLSLGYPAENIVNIPQGYELRVHWNTGNGEKPENYWHECC